ncbi:cytochrome P450 [Dendrothele bispora CBS 962.96]|uniref:Cytochrome P450 n=1 Tax=Dendrothele bispora (strain CBS 962.96) TaxID=1314807 RepID=A0A4S8L657_DENBC|nr:cytochrome P450 [Dendrothele bispora CBS 962.96]
MTTTGSSTSLYALKLSDILFLSLAVWLISKLVSRLRQNLNLAPLKGPPRESLIFGVLKHVNQAPDSGAVYEEWSAKYGPVYQIPGVLGSKRVVLMDPKAVAHFYARETTTYVQTGMSKSFIKRMFGNGILVAEGDSHKRQRKALTPAFSNTAIRRLTAVFYDSAYKLKTMWDGMIESNPDGQVIDVQSWMNRVSLDSIGIAGFSHDFNSLAGEASSVSDLFDTFAGLKPPPKTLISKMLAPLTLIIFLLGTVFPIVLSLPTERSKLMKKLRADTTEIADVLLGKTRKEKELGLVDEKGDRSIVGLLIKAEDPNSALRLSKEEISAQMTTLLLAGYETTSISLTWALVELCLQPHIQAKLREELSRVSGDPTWDQLTSATDIPYLDAVVQETLRMHPPLGETVRVAATDDVVPLSSPLSLSSSSSSSTTTSSSQTSGVAIPKGTSITIPIRGINRSEAFWGEDAKSFRPERWLENGAGIPDAAKEVSGHRHLLTFVDGPRTCLGKGFALAEFKAVLSVLIRNYTFEFVMDGEDKVPPKIEVHRSILPRPKIEGQQGARVPLRVRRV